MMNDNEIIKALECCCDEEVVHFCSKGPMYIQDKENDFCQEDLAKKALDLINRQKAEIEQLEKRLKGQKHALFEQQSYTAELQAEIERLQKKNEELAEILSDTIRIRYAECRAEAIKEFAERLKGKICDSFGFVMHGKSDIDIDKLVKEMVGDIPKLEHASLCETETYKVDK